MLLLVKYRSEVFVLHFNVIVLTRCCINFKEFVPKMLRWSPGLLQFVTF